MERREGNVSRERVEGGAQAQMSTHSFSARASFSNALLSLGLVKVQKIKQAGQCSIRGLAMVRSGKG